MDVPWPEVCILQTIVLWIGGFRHIMYHSIICGCCGYLIPEFIKSGWGNGYRNQAIIWNVAVACIS